jgi:hypothetical protein
MCHKGVNRTAGFVLRRHLFNLRIDDRRRPHRFPSRQQATIFQTLGTQLKPPLAMAFRCTNCHARYISSRRHKVKQHCKTSKMRWKNGRADTANQKALTARVKRPTSATIGVISVLQNRSSEAGKNRV